MGFVFGGLICLGMLAIGGLWYALCITRDRPKRAVYSVATAHLTRQELDKARHRNLRILAQYVQARVGAKPSLRNAENAVVMVTVLSEHIVRVERLDPPKSYLKARREALREAAAFDLKPRF